MNTYQAKIGYARTSTVDPNLDTQIEALTAAGCGMVRQEQRSGATLDGRPELKTVLDFIHPGETLVVTRIDRLARSMQDLQTIVAKLKEKGAHLAWPPLSNLLIRRPLRARPSSTCLASLRNLKPTSAGSGRPRGSRRPNGKGSIGGARPSSIWRPFRPSSVQASPQRKLPVKWGSRVGLSIKMLKGNDIIEGRTA